MMQRTELSDFKSESGSSVLFILPFPRFSPITIPGLHEPLHLSNEQAL